MSEVTVLIPFHRDGNRDWLDQTLRSFPQGAEYIVLENDGELAEAKNEGLRQAKTEFVLFFDADDVALPGFIDSLLFPSWNADVVYGTAVYTDPDLVVTHTVGAAPFSGQRLLTNNFIPGSSLVRREKALAVGGFDPSLTVLEDWDLWVRMFRAGARFKPAENACFAYRQHEESRNRQYGSDLEQIKSKIRGDVAETDATFYCQATPATTYVRCQLPAAHLPAIVRPDIALDSEGQLPEHRGKAMVVQFPADITRGTAMEFAHEAGIRTLVEVDDNYVIKPGKTILERSNWSLETGDKLHSRQAHRFITGRADGVIATTPFLADRYRKVNPNVYVCPNGVEPRDWPEPSNADDGVLRILWAASRSHDTDIPLVSRALEWASRQRDVEVHVLGLQPHFQFPHGHLPWLDDLDAYRYVFHRYDIGIAPIRQTPFGMARSDLKALEYTMGGLCSVLSDLPPYEAWTDGENCLKVANAKGFSTALRFLIENRDSVKQIAAEARKYVLKERTAEAQAPLWQEAIDG